MPAPVASAVVDLDAAVRRAAAEVEPGGRLVGAHELTGGVSADVVALDVESADGARRRVVFRSHRGDAEHAYRLARKELHLLDALHRRGLAVPATIRAVGADRDAVPWFVMAWIDGTPTVAARELPDALAQMARFLVQVHAVDPATLGVAELEPIEDPVASIGEYLPPTPAGAKVRAAVGAGALTAGLAARTVVLHGDYWPGNVLWRDGRLLAVVDWEDACVGDPLADLATARVELECRYGTDAMERFTAEYLALQDEVGAPVAVGALPTWDLYASAAALSAMHAWGLDPAEEAHRRRVTQQCFERAADGIG